MKDFILVFIIGIVLIILSSTNCFLKIANRLSNEQLEQYIDDSYMIKSNGSIPLHLGNSDIVVQGEGDESSGDFLPKWKIDKKQEVNETEEFPKVFNINKKVNNETYEKSIINKEITTLVEKEKNNMNDMLFAFWHGVAAVLIGEVGALLVALAWTKIYKNNNGKTNDI